MSGKYVRFAGFLLLVILAPWARAQVSVSEYGAVDPDQPKLPQAKIERSELKELDVARKVIQLDALPDGSHWIVVDKFGLMLSLTYDGLKSEREFNEIRPETAQLSPNGDYLVWLGLERHITETGFDSTIVYVYKNQDEVGHFLGEYPSLVFSRTGKSWGAVLPYANVYQKGDRDFVIINGKIVGKNQAKPRELSFDHSENEWAYRTTVGMDERLVTSNGTETLLTHVVEPSPYKPSDDSTIYYFTPDLGIRNQLLLGRDYNFHFDHVAMLRRTNYLSANADTSRMYLTFQGRNLPMHRWISNVLIDSAGKHLVYFANDPAQEKLGKQGDYRKTIVVHDGQTISGVFDEAGRIFLSPSGKHVLYSNGFQRGGVYLDKRELEHVTQAQTAVWSPDESRVAYSATGAHGKVFVVLDGKRSPDFEQIGRIGWLPDGKAIQYVALVNGKLLKVKQYL